MIPVILIHQGASERYPLNSVMAQAYKFGNRVELLNDARETYGNSAREFEKYYEHLSGNHVDFEKFCFARWFILLDWMRANDRDVVFYQDSDVLLYCDVTKEFETWGAGYAFTLALGTSAATSYFTRAGLQAFCDFVMDTYMNRNALFVELQRIFVEMQAQRLPGGVCDMTLFKFFKAQVTHVSVGEMTRIVKPPAVTWDHNINSADGFVMENGIKQIEWDNEFPYGRSQNNPYLQTRFNALHFQGGAKKLIRGYAR